MFASLFKREDAWHALKQPVPELAGMYFLMTASGAYLSSLANDGSRGCGVIELDADGSAWRIRWGFEDGARPSSELETPSSRF